MRWDTLASLIRKDSLKNYAEVGIANGINIKNILAILGENYKCNIIAIDQYKEYPNDGNGRLKRIEQNKKTFLDGVAKDPRVMFFNGSSKAAAYSTKDNSQDIIFIDAEHTYNAVKEDINLWWGKLKKGGYYCGHDYGNVVHVGVKKAVDEFCKEKGLTPTICDDQVWYIQKVNS